MKKVICSQITTLSPEEHLQVVGGATKTSDMSDKVNGAVCKATGGGSNCGGCGSGASNRNDNGYDKYKTDYSSHNYNQNNVSSSSASTSSSSSSSYPKLSATSR